MRTALTLTERTVLAGQEVLSGKRRRALAFLPFAGPSIIVSIAYMDPGNFATNIQAGARFDYGLLWVVLLANLIAMLFQAMSAKLGIVTGRNLPELCRDRFPRAVVWGMWGISEVAAMATELAEFVGSALALSLLVHLPLLSGMLVTAVVSYGVSLLQLRGFRPVELIIAACAAVIGVCYLIELVIVPPQWSALLSAVAHPQLADGDAVILAVGIVGATVMPHAIYLHSSLTQDRLVPRSGDERRRLVRISNREVMITLSIAGAVNMAMIAMAAAAFYQSGNRSVAEIPDAYATLIPLFGSGAALVFLTALLASGLSSSVVGVMAGQTIMQGFVGFRIPLWLRRVATMVPSFIVIGCGVDATRALIASQVVLSLAVPVPMIALLILSRRNVIGEYAHAAVLSVTAAAAAAIVVALNGLLLWSLLA